MIFSLGLVII